MKVCFCGLGSIGKRHLRNLHTVAHEQNLPLEVHALRKTHTPLDDTVQALLSRQLFEERELDSDYDIAFITNPTSLHYDTVKAMAGRTEHLFIEKPLFDSAWYRLEDLKLNPQGVSYAAGPLRFSPVIQKLGEILSREPVYSVRVLCSSYLPDWRPGDYRKVYSARKELGGGVALDLIHEWDYLVALFGFPQTVFRVSGKYSPLEIDSEDLSVYIARYPDKAVELHLDYFGRVPRREIELFTESGTITGDLFANTVTFTDGRERIHYEEEENESYLREMRFFLSHVESGAAYSNLNRCLAVLNIALGKEQA
ncbi:Gfo/Idh/MocA family protein [Caproiciproducens faecalis]|uniref:Gfo/Idh/MocA family oxidoreductase n=1 Tax=Caproiciproducens faecalis TaxID=2820301 RepID=A0ABS7DM20_9FIRM|nr:Gfo/Idh/MocA family oxidoreductase [Caproiciproducens faecalis]MBW7572351.1 Gfo/Idh/MocA family oxidoreductase [Caproiciproducens faecalis]